jgi:hypothetical protein
MRVRSFCVAGFSLLLMTAISAIVTQFDSFNFICQVDGVTGRFLSTRASNLFLSLRLWQNV